MRETFLIAWVGFWLGVYVSPLLFRLVRSFEQWLWNKTGDS